MGQMRHALAVVVTLLLAACGSDDSSTTPGGSAGNGGGAAGSSQLAENCSGRCQTRAEACGAPASMATSECAKLCALSVTESQALCLEATPCAQMQAAFAGGQYPCGIGQSGTGGSGGGGTGGSAGGGAKKALGESCACEQTGDWSTCSGTDAPCSAELTCVVYMGAGMCTTECTSTCDGGLTCTDLMPQGVSMGTWCWKN